MKEICISSYIGMFCDALRRTFGERICFAGLQGSYGRGEATESSDIDLVVILDRLSPQDIAVYRHMLSGLPYRDAPAAFFPAAENWKTGSLRISSSFISIPSLSSAAWIFFGTF